MYFQHNFKFLPIQRKGLILISILIFELSKYHGTTSTKLVLQFLSKYQLQVICYFCLQKLFFVPTIKTTFLIFLLRFSLAHLVTNSLYLKIYFSGHNLSA